MEEADSSEDAPRQSDAEAEERHPGRASTAAASGTTGEAAAGAEPAAEGHDARDEKKSRGENGCTETPKDPIVENLERLLQERTEQRKQTTTLRKEIKKVQRQKARIRKNATCLTDADLVAVLRARGIDPTARSSDELAPSEN